MKFTALLLVLFSFSEFSNYERFHSENSKIKKTIESKFTFWTNLTNDNSDAVFDIVENNSIMGSNKVLRVQVNELGIFEDSVQSVSNLKLPNKANQKVTISFYAKANASLGTPRIKLCLNDSSVGGSVFKEKTFELKSHWQLFTHVFLIDRNVPSYKIGFHYLSANSTYYINQVNAIPNQTLLINPNERHQTVQGFGGGIKRRTEKLNALEVSNRDLVEDKVYKDLKINMIRFFIHHTIENNGNDNDDSNVIDMENTSWNYYSGQTFQVGETLERAIAKSDVGIDHLIGNCNSAPGWMKVNDSHKRLNENENVSENTLITGMENEFSEFILIFLQGIKQRHGIDVTEVSITNEPDFINTYESMNLTPEQLKNILPILRSRLDQSSFSQVSLISPETARVNSGTGSQFTEINSTVSFIGEMFNDSQTKNAVDIVGTHTYGDKTHDADWASLVNVVDEKPVWVTESAILKSLDLGMEDASNYIKWITRGFNEGGMTAYMVHLLFDEHIYETPEIADNEGSSGLVVWDEFENIIFPKRYYTFKHFSNLSGKGYTRVSHTHSQSELYVTSFVSPEDDQLVIHVFNSSDASVTMSVQIPNNTDSISQYTTDNLLDFHMSTVDFINTDTYFEGEFASMSMNSYVFDLSSSMSKQSLEIEPITIFPNPTSGLISFSGIDTEIKCSIFSISGKKLFEQTVSNENKLDLSGLKKGLYFIEIQHRDSIQNFKVLLNR